MAFRGRRHNLGLHILLFFILTPFFQGAVEIVCPQIGYFGSPTNLTCIGTGRTHSYIQPTGGILTTCNMSSSECFPEATVTIPNSSYSILTVPMVNLSHQGNWSCSVGDDLSYCLFTVANAVEIVCPQIGYLGLPTNLTCIGTGRTHTYIQPTGVVLTTCNMSSSECFPEATVTIPNSSYSILTVPMINLSHQGHWTCSVGDDLSHCLFTVAMPEDKDTSNRTSMAVIIGSVVAGIVVVTIIIMLVVFLMKMKSKRVEQPETNTVTYAPDSIYDVAGQTNVTSRDVNKPSASYDNILNARYTHSPEESSLYDLASR